MVFPEDRTRDQVEASQVELLRGLISDLWEQNPFWRAKLSNAGWDKSKALIESLDNVASLSQLPLCTKQELVDDQDRQQPYGTNLSSPINAYTRLHQTSGTTGRPLRWLDTAESWGRLLKSWEQIFRISGVLPEDRFCFPFSFGPFIGFWSAFEAAQQAGHLCLAGGGMSSESRLRMIDENSATVLCCTPTYALRLAEVASVENRDLATGSVRMLIVAGEPGGSVPGVRGRIEKAWGARVIDHWGMTELGPVAVECDEAPGGMHILESDYVAEVIDPETLLPLPAGEQGELVITTLGRGGSPVLRYRTGDLVVVDQQPCGCGRCLLRLDGGILSRADDMITIRGNNVFPSSIESVIRQVDAVSEFRVEVRTERAMDHLVIQVESATGANGEEVSAEVTAAIMRSLHFQVEVEAVAPGSLPRFELKGRRFFRGPQGETAMEN
ncbi:MAG: CoF synthetase [Planctomycetaceae bacterium]|jgi:phenylacetate-CoA ligase|nr:CoF synthetase [Planctomycetaceae bacterium]